MINFMAVEGRGLICAPLIEDRCDELDLELMVNRNNAAFETPFTVSVDVVGHGCTTGISAMDRAKTIQALIDPATRPEELGRPGHIFPLRARHVAFSVGRDIPKLPSIWRVSPGLNPLASSWRS